MVMLHATSLTKEDQVHAYQRLQDIYQMRHFQAMTYDKLGCNQIEYTLTFHHIWGNLKDIGSLFHNLYY